MTQTHDINTNGMATPLSSDWAEIQEDIYHKLLDFGLPPFAALEGAGVFRRWGVLPSDEFEYKFDTGQIVIKTSNAEYLVTAPLDFFDRAKIKVVKGSVKLRLWAAILDVI